MNNEWIPIYTAPSPGETPYDWSSSYVGECTWGAYYRVMKNGWTPPCYYDRASKISGYTNAKDWLKEYREPWSPIYISENPDYEPVPGDVLVFDGNYGHVAVIESKKTDDIFIVSDWNRVASHAYGIIEWKKGKSLTRSGSLCGYLHYDPNMAQTVSPVKRDESVDQIQATDGTLRVRLAPNLQGSFYCSIIPGYYNVLSITKATDEDKAKVEGLKEWYEIEKGKYCANITTKFLSAGKTDPFADISKLLSDLQSAFEDVTKENNDYKTRISKAIDILSGKESV